QLSPDELRQHAVHQQASGCPRRNDTALDGGKKSKQLNAVEPRCIRQARHTPSNNKCVFTEILEMKKVKKIKKQQNRGSCPPPKICDRQYKPSKKQSKTMGEGET
ncbi:MAG: hypothetical protein ABJX82_21575, partial [Paracoccaceae bacterium]